MILKISSSVWLHIINAASKNRLRQQKMNMEISAAKRERDFYLTKIEQSLAHKHIQERRRKVNILQFLLFSSFLWKKNEIQIFYVIDVIAKLCLVYLLFYVGTLTCRALKLDFCQHSLLLSSHMNSWVFWAQYVHVLYILHIYIL